MQVETSTVATSSPLSSLVPSSVPSIEPAPPVAGARARVTYSRKPLATEHGDDDGSSRVAAEASSSSPPSDNLFDSPMRSYGRNDASRVEQDANDVTVTTDVSPATTAHAANSAVKLGTSSLFRRVDSQPSQHSDNDDDDHPQSSTESPAVHRTRKFNLGMARAIFDSDSDTDADAVRSKPASQSLTRDDDDDAIIARIRAQAVRDTDSDPFTGSLSSVPPSSSQAESSSHRPSLDSGDEQDVSITLTRRRGAKISAMKGKSNKPIRSKFSSSSDQEAGAASDDDVDDDHVQARKARTFKLASSASSASATPADHADAHAGSSVNTLSRREKMDALAARFRKAHGEPEAVVETNAQADPLLDAFFGGGSPGRIPSRSPSLDIQGSDDDEHNDAMPAFMAPNADSATATAKSKSKKNKKNTKAVATERDILSDLEDDFDRANAKVASKRATAAAAKDKAQPKVKPLTKKELETMHRQTARLARENRTRLAPTHQKKTIGLNELLSKIQASEANRNAISHTASPQTSADNASDGSAQPSSQIPSGQSKSQHASDPIESDPIPERSSLHPNYSSSPVVPMSRQQERRLGLDPSTSHANFLQTTAAAAGRVAGLATKQDPDTQKHQHLLARASDQDDDDAQLPDLATIVKQSRDQQQADKEAAQRMQRLRDMKLRLLEKSRQQPPTVASKDVVAAAQVGDPDDEDLEVYQPGSVLAAKHNLPVTPGKKRPTDLLYREIGIRPGKTPPSRKSYTGTNANGSPNAALHIGEDAENADGQDDLVVTDSQLRSAGKGLFIASDKAAGHVPATQPPQPASAQARQDDSHQHPSATQVAGRAGPPKMTQAQLNATLMRKMQAQSIKARSQAGTKNAKASSVSNARSAAPDVNDLLKSLGEAANSDAQGAHSGDQDEDEDDPDYIMPPARDAESVIGSDIDMGSASEIEPADENEDFVDMGSADEDDDNHDTEQAGIRDTIEDADEEHDSEKENAPPPASQQSQRSNASPSLSRSLLPSRAVMDDDEDEMPAARLNARRGRRSAFADDDDEDGDDEADENPLQPGPFDGGRSSAQLEEASQSQGRVRVPLGDISSQSIDQSMPFSPSLASSAAFPQSLSPSLAAAAAPRRDPLVVPLTAGQDEDESFRTDDIPSQAADLGRFFEPTMPPPSAVKSAAAASQAPKSFWDQTQTQTQSQSQDPSQLPSSSRPPHATDAARPLVRDESANSALGAFFQDTQQEELRGESLDIFDNHKVAGGKAPGFTQFFHDGTPPPTADAPAGSKPSVWDASTMPPPKSTEVDAFAALRKAQMGEAMDFLDPTPSALPSFDESQAEREAYAQAQANGQMANGSPEKMYMNRDGFFTQTKPSQQVGLWSQYDSQSQSQSQHPSAGAGAGAWPSPAVHRASVRRGSDISNVSGDRNAVVSDEEEDDVEPVQLKRLRRGVARFADAEVAEQQQDDGDADSEVDDENGPPSSQPEPKPRNAFDVLRLGAMQPADDDEAVVTTKKRKSAFIEGEAEESEDEELGGNKRGDGGGLKGVFGDDDGSASGGDEDEDDEDDANAADLQELVDNERDLDEAEKDEAARARFRADMEAKDREDLEIHQKAIQGGYRSRRRGAGLNGIEEYLDEDAEDEELKRRAAMGSHAAMSARKKRKMLNGTEDGMDALAAHEEAQAFVNSYAATHRIDHESEKYDFLAMAAEDQEDEDGEDSGDDDMDEEEDADRAGNAEEQDVEEDAFGPVPKQPRTIRYNDIASIVRERKKAKKLRALDDDDEEDAHDAAQARENEWDSDDDDTEARLATALHDRIKGVSTQNMPTSATQPKRKPQGATYGRSSATAAASHRDDVDAMDVDDTPDQDEADDDQDTNGSLIARLIGARPPTRPSALRSSSSMAVDTLEDAEPEWGNDANIVRAPKPAASSSAGSQNSASARKMGSSPFAAAKGSAKAKAGSSMLLSKQAIMRRESGFSSSSSGSR
ncbi:conserved hypothetical protein [Sporisorium reilianum SRZ2]|uniref:DNA replication checkpoint mediator MRC1 domain-containing protein n=1 Tax=Sporisorium reilianum (strain SRZ2) TaxID=999809 RepID=E6ZZ27_SPORE|nr:conserved hypothetical protein [Sporisorium reilianum SRZ2]